MNKKGKLFVISAPSGAGKTTLCDTLRKNFENLEYSVSYTTRKPRPDETNGIDYFFITEEEFKKMIDENIFIEWAKVHGNYYGTSRAFIEQSINSGKNILLDIDPQGARKLKKSVDEGIFIFIVAPSLKALKDRLLKRRTESEEILKLRLENAKNEVKLFKEYDYIILNNNFEKAYRELESIYIAEHLRTKDLDNIETIMKLEE
jgi:guanylate kinase